MQSAQMQSARANSSDFRDAFEDPKRIGTELTIATRLKRQQRA